MAMRHKQWFDCVSLSARSICDSSHLGDDVARSQKSAGCFFMHKKIIFWRKKKIFFVCKKKIYLDKTKNFFMRQKISYFFVREKVFESRKEKTYFLQGVASRARRYQSRL